MTELFLLLLFVSLIAAGSWFYYHSSARRPFRRSDLSEFETGLNALLENELQLAAKHLANAAKEDPDNVFARVWLGTVLRKQNDIERALKIHMELAIRESLSAAERISIHKALAEDFHVAQHPEKTLEHLDLILAVDKSNAWALERRLQYLAGKGDWSGYIDTSLKLSNLRKKSLDARRMAIICTLDGDRLGAAGKGKEGRLRYREAIKYDASFPGAYLGLAESYRREKRISDAIKEVELLMENSPESADIAFPLLEAILFEQGRFEEVEGFYRSFLTKQHHIVQGYVALATIAERKADNESALRILREGLEANPGNELLQYELARHLTRLKKVDELAKPGLQAMKRLAPPHSAFNCSNCGFSSDAMRWFCPSCGAWESFNT
ncbi:MAG: tetratricopeptide repeat protein [bacterium]|nr:tetratricopeptide repeat protein [bacterium]